ncbi:MAG: hypothetical protein U5Q44_14175 [Dehalococcoidia bacterium]|nr:hypothetical protein [Dehalococcoidia bacterium]
MDEASAAAAYRGDLYAEDPSVERVVTPLWREFLAPCEWTRLRMSPVYWGWGIPHGAGEPVSSSLAFSNPT